LHLKTYGNGVAIYYLGQAERFLSFEMARSFTSLGRLELAMQDIFFAKQHSISSIHEGGLLTNVFHAMDRQLKVVFRGEGRVFTYRKEDLDLNASLFPLFRPAPPFQLDPGFYRFDTITGPIGKADLAELSEMKSIFWKNPLLKGDLWALNTPNFKLRADNQIRARRFQFVGV